MIGKIFITSSGYDPEMGKHVKDPYLEDAPSLGACRPDVRRIVKPGDYIFAVSGKIVGVKQYVMGGFQVAEKIDALKAYEMFPEQRLRLREDGELTGNIIVDSNGEQHELDNHQRFAQRIQNYVVGCDPTAPSTPGEIARAREETLGILSTIFGKVGAAPFDILGRSARTLNEAQVNALLMWLTSLKEPVSSGRRVVGM